MKAAIYARISLDKEDTGLGVERQLEDCRAKAKALGWKVVGEYVDNNLSGSKANVVRPEYNKLMDDMKSGKVKALIVYSLDRLTRKPRDLEEFMELADAKGIKLANISGEVDLSNANGRMVARIMGAVNRQEAERIGERVQRQKLQEAMTGAPPKGRFRAYGYTDEYEVIPEEAAVVKEAAKLFISGMTMHGVSVELNKQGKLHYGGKKWTADSVKRIIRKPEYAALRSFNGEVVAKGKWKAILTKEQHEQITARLQGNKAFGDSTVTKYLLVGILRCGECGASLRAQGYKDYAKSRYACDSAKGGCGKIAVRMKAVDKFVQQLTVEAIKKLPEVEAEQVKDLTAKEIERLEAKVTEARQGWKDELITFQDFVEVRQDAEEKIKELRKNQLKKAAAPVDTSQSFIEASTDKQRATIAKMFGVIGIAPASRKGMPFSPDRIIIDK